RSNGWDRDLSPADQARLRRQHDINSELYAKYAFYDLGFNVRPTEITGFLGLQQLALLEENIAVRRRNYHEVEKAVLRNPAFIPIEHKHVKAISPFAMPFICRSRELFQHYTAVFAAAGIEIRPMIAGNIQLQPFYRKPVAATFALPNAAFIPNCGFYCGNYPELTRADLDTLTGCLQVQPHGSAGGLPDRATSIRPVRAVATRAR